MEKPKDLIFILEEQLKFIKMTVTEREYLENTINKLKEAINYTRCCTELVCDKCGKKDIDSIDVNLYKCIWCKNEFTN